MAQETLTRTTFAEQELTALLHPSDEKFKELITGVMGANRHLFEGTKFWDTGVIVDFGMPNQRFVKKPIYELKHQEEYPWRNHYLTEEGIYMAHEETVPDEHGFRPVWGDATEIDIAEYPKFAEKVLDLIQARREFMAIRQFKNLYVSVSTQMWHRIFYGD